jgi:hypothetical protein
LLGHADEAPLAEPGDAVDLGRAAVEPVQVGKVSDGVVLLVRNRIPPPGCIELAEATYSQGVTIGQAGHDVRRGDWVI